MKNRRLTLILCSTLLFLSIAESASAWGPEARRRIVSSALSIVRQAVPRAITSETTAYDADVIKGMEDGWASIAERLPIGNEQQAVEAISYELDTLKAALPHGAGSHFAYRMGVLAALTSDAMLPYGITFTSKEDKLGEQLKTDIDRIASRLKFQPKIRNVRFIHATNSYYRTYRRDIEGDKNIIADDYRRGKGFQGYMTQATPAYYQRAIEAVVDVWYTVFTQKSRQAVLPPSSRTMTAYYIDEIEYLLDKKDNFEFANRAYNLYEKFNPDLKETHLTIGDLYYHYGVEKEFRESVQRGVDEWKKAQTNSGKQRQAASERLSDHYISEGDSLYKRASSPIGQESDFTDALNAFRLALEYNRTNPLAADRISETSKIIQQRREDYEMQQAFIDSSMSIMKGAERSLVAKDYSSTLGSYNQALNLLTSITDQFSDLQIIAKDTSSTINKEVKRVINDIFDSANAAIDEGDTHLYGTRYDEAIKSYEKAKNMVKIVEVDTTSYNHKQKMEMLDQVEGLIQDAQASKASAANKAQQSSPPAIGNL
jgi:tetratricopeptide (TPR) repeat protein